MHQCKAQLNSYSLLSTDLRKQVVLLTSPSLVGECYIDVLDFDRAVSNWLRSVIASVEKLVVAKTKLSFIYLVVRSNLYLLLSV